MASIQLCLLFILAICCISLVDTRGLGGDVNCSSLAANNPVIRIKPGFSVAAVAKCKGGNRKFTDYGTEGYSLTGYFTGSKPGCKWQRKKAFRNKVVYELVVHLKTRRVGGKRHAMKKTFTCTFPYRGGSMSTSSPPKPDKGNPFMPPKGMMAMFGKLPNADLVHFKVDTTSQTKQKYSYQARFRLRKKHKKWCGPAPYVTNASRSSTRAKSYKRIVYRCRPGFVPYRGITMIKCKSNRRYSKPTPRCVKVAPLSSKRSSRRSCGRTPSVRNSISGSGKPIKANQSVRYMCKKGYRLFMGISSIKCRPNGRFTRKPICDKATPRSCGRSPRVANSVSGSRRLSRFNRVVKYKCRRGYRFYKNKSTIKCLSNGKFTTPPRCVRAKGSRSCGRSPRVRNSVSGSRRRTRTNQVVRYRCRRGYKFLRGRSSIKCLKNGKFTPKPKCVKVSVKTCGKTPKVRNSVSARVQSKVNKVYRYKCKPGYKFLMGRSTIKCRSSGKFTRKPRCVKGRSRSCGRSPRVANSVSGSRRLSRFNRVVKYKCRRGYRFYKNKSTIKCLSNGKFTTPPKCVRVTSCGKSPAVSNSISGSGKKSRIYQVIRYKCKRGYRFLWEISAIWCRPDGRFSFKPRCIKVDGNRGSD